MALAPSTWHTVAPALRHTTDAAPVYPNRLSTLTCLPAPSMSRDILSQFTACSGKSPVCLKPMSLSEKDSPRQLTENCSGTGLKYFHLPPPSRLRS